MYHFLHYTLRAAFRRPLRTAHGPWSERETILIRLEDDAGRRAFGEIAPLPDWGTETPGQAAAFCAGLPPRIDDALVAGISDDLPCCQFAFASALEAWRERAPSPNPATAFPMAALLPAGPDALPAASAALRRGHSCLKWKVGVASPTEEIALLHRLFDLLPAGACLRLDANGAWDLPTAETWLRACANRPVECVEQPLPVGQEDAMGRLALDHPTPLALDESIARPDRLRRCLERGWPGLLVVKPSLAGPPDRLHSLLLPHAARCIFSSAMEAAIGAHAALRFSVRLGDPGRALGFGSAGAFADERLNLPDPGPTLPPGWLDRHPPDTAWDCLPNKPIAS